MFKRKRVSYLKGEYANYLRNKQTEREMKHYLTFSRVEEENQLVRIK